MRRCRAAAVWLLTALIAPLLCGCGSGAGPTFVVRDSAGIRIVENRAPAWPAARAWRLARQPKVRIGVAEGDPDYEMADVIDAVRLADGRIVVADRGSAELRFYDSHGRFLRSAGSRGDGPGQFRELGWLTVNRDSLWACDLSLSRVSVFDSAGRFVRDFSLSYFMGATPPVGMFADGSLVVQRLHPDSSMMKPGLHTLRQTYEHLSPAGLALGSFGKFPWAQDYVAYPSGHYDPGIYLFGRLAASTVAGSDLYFGSAAAYEIRVYSEDGRLRSLIRRRVPPAPVTSRDIDAVVRSVQAQVSGAAARRTVAMRVRKFAHASTMPAYSGFRVDALGDLWVGHYRWLRQPPAAWTVFDPTGRMLGDVAVPPRFTIYEIGRDYVLGMRPDSLGVQRVELYALKKPQ